MQSRNSAVVAIDKIPQKEDILDTPLDNLMKVYKMCLDMENICIENKGIGLSAVQIGIPWKLFVVRRTDFFEYFLNCDYAPLVDVNQKHLQSIEGCLSLPRPDGSSRQFLVERYPKVKVIGKRMIVDDSKPKLEDININYDNPNDIYTIVMQHEIDHNYGAERLICNIGKEIELTKVK